MRLEKLTIRGLGPFKETATLDLTQIDHKIIAVTGANGAGKCLPGRSVVYTPSGPTTIGEVVSSKAPVVMGYVNGRIAPVTVTKWFEIGEKRVLRLVARGWRLDVAHSHPILTSRGWARAEDLKEGDLIAMAKRLPVDGDLSASDDEVLLAGYLIGDGCLGQSSLAAQYKWKQDEFARTLRAVFPHASVSIANRRVELRRGNTTPAMNLRVAAHAADSGVSIWDVLGTNTPRFLKGQCRLETSTVDALERQGVDMSEYRGYLTGTNALGQWAERFGICGLAGNKTLGSFSRIQTQQVPALLSALWFTDGFVSQDVHEVSYSTASEILAHQIRDLLLRLGILSSLRSKLVEGKRYFNLALTAKGIVDFAKIVPMKGPKADRLVNLSRLSGSDEATNFDSIPFDVWSQFIEPSGRSRTWSRARSGMSRSTFLKMGGPAEIADRHIWYAPLSSITDIGMEQCFDIEVDSEEHAYVADAAVVHNSTALELFPSALYRECPTRGTLASLATRRDAFVEAQVVNGTRFTVRQLVDKVSGKGETVLLDEAGQAINTSGKLREADAWIARHILAPEVVYASIFAHQGSAGFIELKPADRKKVLLRVLGIERLEAMAEKARERVRTAKEELRLTEVRVADEKARGVSVEAAEAELRRATEADTEAGVALFEARERLSALKAEVALVVEARKAWEAQWAAFNALTERALGIDGRRADLVKRLENNRGVLKRADEIRDAVQRAAELDALIREADMLNQARHQAIMAAEAAFKAAMTQVEVAKQRLGDAKRSKKQAEDMAGLWRPKVEEARAALPAAREEARLAREAYEAAGKALERLQGQATATADERIQDLRGALGTVVEAKLYNEVEAERAQRVAGDALNTDDYRVTMATALPGQIAEARKFARETMLAVSIADEKVQRLEQALGREEDLARYDAEAAHWASRIGPAEVALSEAEAHRDLMNDDVITAGERLPLDVRDAAANRADLEPLLKLVGPLAQAEARIAELEPQLAQLDAEFAQVEAERLGMTVAAAPPVAPSTTLHEAEVQKLERAATHASNVRALAERSVQDAKARAERLATLEAERVDIVARLADWTRTAHDLGKDGIQALEIDAAGPDLSTLVNDLLHTCHGSRFSVSVETTKLSSDGKRQLEGCDVWVVDTEGGREGAVETFSGGQRVLIGEAIALALSVMATRRAGIERPTLVRDETGAALDPDNGRAYVAMLRRAAEMVDADKVLFVSHSPELQELADARIVVADGGFTVEG